MRITETQKQRIHDVVTTCAGDNAEVKLFGSRLDDNAKGGDIDLLVTTLEPINNPAELSAQISAKIMREFNGRKVDVLMAAPNLRFLPIHDIATKNGRIL
ncbi:MAG: nucleotidyltransferase domain-containing protein [Methylococcales bacterium]|nr:nucleotidyltransferase domain-containing protein [Methylococcales bacterium]